MRLRAAFGIALALMASGCGSSPTSPTPPPTVTPHTGNPEVDLMLGRLNLEISSALATNQQNLPRNPNNAAQIQAKIALLKQPGLANAIIMGGFYVAATANSMGGAPIRIAAVFPTADMRNDASTAVQQLARALPILEAFMEQPFPHPDVRLWYGFIVGDVDAGADINVEEESSYVARTPPSRLPMEAILVHELSHNYIGHEGLNQFLEMYQYNVVETGSTDPALWTYARTLGPPGDPSISSAALVDVYRLIGHDAMASAYHAVYALNPPYGQPLSSAVKQVFIDRAPESLKAQVTTLMARVVY